MPFNILSHMAFNTKYFINEFCLKRNLPKYNGFPIILLFSWILSTTFCGSNKKFSPLASVLLISIEQGYGGVMLQEIPVTCKTKDNLCHQILSFVPFLLGKLVAAQNGYVKSGQQIRNNDKFNYIE